MIHSVPAGNQTVLLKTNDIETPAGIWTLVMSREDLTEIYPGMYRFCLSAIKNRDVISEFRTNTMEYSPGCPLRAEEVILEKTAEWETCIRADPAGCIPGLPEERDMEPPFTRADVVILQGSPRGDGNCAILAGMVKTTAESSGKSVEVIYPDDLGLHPCIGCYQCYNTGVCVFHDDMTGIIRSIDAAGLVVVCTPVYSNSVPGALKILIDRCLSYHAKKTLDNTGYGQKGILLAVSGRAGQSNLSCVRQVFRAFMEICGIDPVDELLSDGLDIYRDVREITGIENRIRDMVLRHLN